MENQGLGGDWGESLEDSKVGTGDTLLHHDEELIDHAPPPPQTDEQIRVMRLARKQFKRVQDWEQQARNNWKQDLRFAEADAYNGWQWPDDVRQDRDISNAPSLTINKTRQFCIHIINDAKQSKPSIDYRPVGNGATKESADVLKALVRHIEYDSNAEAAYTRAIEFQVKAGYGYWRVGTCWDGDTWNQKITINEGVDPMNLYVDPDCKQRDKSDMKFAFIFDRVEKTLFDTKWPQFRGHPPSTVLDTRVDDDAWFDKQYVRVAEYFRVVPGKDTLYSYHDPKTGELKAVKKSVIGPKMAKLLEADPATRKREIHNNKVMYYFLVGDDVVEEKVWPGTIIPIVPLIGEETIVDGLMDRKGHTRALLDPQKMYNYWASAAVEFGALQSKTPYIAPAQAIEGNEVMWNNANQENYSVLPWNHIDDDGNPIPKPERASPPMQAPLYLEGMKQADGEMMAVSGQYQAQLGQQGNERTGIAIQERQRQGDNATYHYIDRQGEAIRLTGRIILELIPIIYDTKRVLQVLAEDGKSFEVEIDPDAEKAFEAHLNNEAQVVKRILNPSIGDYSVQADVGPGYGTKREEAFNVYSQILTQNKELTPLIGDILFDNADFPGAEEVSERMRRMVPRQALGEGPTMAEQKLTAENQQLVQLQKEMFEKLTAAEMKLKGKDEMRDIDAYKAETDRTKALADMLPMDAQGLSQMIHQLVKDSINTHLTAVVESNDSTIGENAAGPSEGDAGAAPSPPPPTVASFVGNAPQPSPGAPA